MEEFLSLNWALLLPAVIIQLLLMIIALIDCIRIEKTNGPRWLWVLIIVIVSIFGPIAYFLLGRRTD